jgi:hypothetical protein
MEGRKAELLHRIESGRPSPNCASTETCRSSQRGVSTKIGPVTGDRGFESVSLHQRVRPISSARPVQLGSKKRSRCKKGRRGAVPMRCLRIPVGFAAPTGRAGPAPCAAGRRRPAAVPRTTGRAPGLERSHRKPTAHRRQGRRSPLRFLERRARSWQR